MSAWIEEHRTTKPVAQGQDS